MSPLKIFQFGKLFEEFPDDRGVFERAPLLAKHTWSEEALPPREDTSQLRIRVKYYAYFFNIKPVISHSPKNISRKTQVHF